MKISSKIVIHLQQYNIIRAAKIVRNALNSLKFHQIAEKILRLKKLVW